MAVSQTDTNVSPREVTSGDRRADTALAERNGAVIATDVPAGEAIWSGYAWTCSSRKWALATRRSIWFIEG